MIGTKAQGPSWQLILIILAVLAGVSVFFLYPRITRTYSTFEETLGFDVVCKKTGKTVGDYVADMDLALSRKQFDKIKPLYDDYKECFPKSKNEDILVIALAAKQDASGSAQAQMDEIIEDIV